MEHEFENAVWESCLKTAVIKNSLSETEKIMTDPEYNNTNVPKRYDLKMNKIIRRSRRQIKQRSILKIWLPDSYNINCFCRNKFCFFYAV